MAFDDSNKAHKRVKLRVMGISYSQIQSGAYALILAEVDGPYRIPVVVGAPEAQAIAIKMEGIVPPRPMTHDLFASLAHAYGIELVDVFIHKFEDGIFWSELTFIDRNGHEVVMDARTSDAIAIAMRTSTPIFTTPEILEETGFIMEIQDSDEDDASEDAPDSQPDATIGNILGAENSARNSPGDSHNADTCDELANKSSDDLRKMMEEAIAAEKYELASRINSILKSRE